MKWYEIDFNWYGIWTLKKLGLAKKVVLVKLDQLPKVEMPSAPDLSIPAQGASDMASA